MKNFNIIFFIINIISFILMGLDKYLAIKGYRRIRERTLLNLSLFFGSIGIYTGMYTFRHKTKKIYFKLIIILVIIHIISIIYLNNFYID